MECGSAGKPVAASTFHGARTRSGEPGQQRLQLRREGDGAQVGEPHRVSRPLCQGTISGDKHCWRNEGSASVQHRVWGKDPDGEVQVLTPEEAGDILLP